MLNYIALVIAAALVGVDQLIKVWAVNYLSTVDTMPLIPNILHLTYAENRGAAFSILQNRTTFLIIMSSILIVGFIVVMCMKKLKHPLLIFGASFIVAGGAGNLIDRIFRGFVVDYVDVRAIHFAIFNFADSCITIGVILLIIYILFFDKKEKVAKTDE